VRHTAEDLGVLFPTFPRAAGHTTSVVVLCVIWKARNAMVFNTDHQDVVTISRQLQAHLHLWFCRAPCKLDIEPLKLWCQTIVDVN
jgi:hypothetical protein